MRYTFEDVQKYYELMDKWASELNTEEQSFFHYTSQSSFYAMFQDYIEHLNKEEPEFNRNNYVCLFASQMQYLNDKQEFQEGIQVVKEADIDPKNLFESIFISCFCGTNDLLSQWKYYGKDCGIAIEYDFSENLNVCWYQMFSDGGVVDPPEIYWSCISPHRVFYKKHKEIFEKIRSITKNNTYKDIADKDAANIFVPFCKNHHFSEENESRLVFYPISQRIRDGSKLITKINYRVTNGKIVPQFKCKIAYSDDRSKRTIPIKSIVVGPGHNQRLVFNSIINMLERNKNLIRFFSDEEIDKTIDIQTTPTINGLGIVENRVTYITTDEILISMSSIPFRD